VAFVLNFQFLGLWLAVAELPSLSENAQRFTFSSAECHRPVAVSGINPLFLFYQ